MVVLNEDFGKESSGRGTLIEEQVTNPNRYITSSFEEYSDDMFLDEAALEARRATVLFSSLWNSPQSDKVYLLLRVGEKWEASSESVMKGAKSCRVSYSSCRSKSCDAGIVEGQALISVERAQTCLLDAFSHLRFLFNVI